MSVYECVCVCVCVGECLFHFSEGLPGQRTVSSASSVGTGDLLALFLMLTIACELPPPPLSRVVGSLATRTFAK